ncbi:MAG TPA: hypothetical protein VGL45_03090 [Bradyrhizobium sp.]
MTAVLACSRTMRMLGRVVEAAGLDTAGILRQPAHPMSVGSLQIGLRHQIGDICRILIRQAQFHHRLMNKRLQPTGWDDQFSYHDDLVLDENERGGTPVYTISPMKASDHRPV